MTRKEFLKIAAYLTAGCGKDISEVQADVYYDMLKDLPADVALAAVKKVIATLEYPVLPTVGAIRKAAAELNSPTLPSAAEAWGEVMQAVQKYGYYRKAEALAFLSPPVRQVVEWITWEEICTCEELDVIRGQFRRMYETLEAREKEQAALPEPLKRLANNAVKRLPEVKPLRPELPPAPDQPEEKVSVAEIEAVIRKEQAEDIAARNNRLRKALRGWTGS
jgi:hypothetical protein